MFGGDGIAPQGCSCESEDEALNEGGQRLCIEISAK